MHHPNLAPPPPATPGWSQIYPSYCSQNVISHGCRWAEARNEENSPESLTSTGKERIYPSYFCLRSRNDDERRGITVTGSGTGWLNGLVKVGEEALAGCAAAAETFKEGLKGNDRRRWAVNWCER